jgi:hypothetical protein
MIIINEMFKVMQRAVLWTVENKLSLCKIIYVVFLGNWFWFPLSPFTD